MRPLRGLQETRVATREESGLWGPDRRSALWEAVWGDELRVLPGASQDEAGLTRIFET